MQLYDIYGGAGKLPGCESGERSGRFMGETLDNVGVATEGVNTNGLPMLT